MTQVVVATHGHCFDGMCSAVLFSKLLRAIEPTKSFTFHYHAMGYGPGEGIVPSTILTGDENAVLDYRFSTAPSLTWYFDHHVSAFPTEADRSEFQRRSGQKPSKTFHDGTYGSCTKLIADVARRDFGVSFEGLESLISWADMIDRAAFPSAQMAVERKEPVIRLMAVVEAHGDSAFLSKMIPRLAETSIEQVADDPEIAQAYEPLAALHDAFVARVREHAQEHAGVVSVDLTSHVSDASPKFVTYALYPDSAYSVVLTRSSSKCKISVGYNPWSPHPRRHNIAQICERYGGGGHPVVGAVSTRADEVARAQQITREIVAELSG